jgi:hypothetical protein
VACLLSVGCGSSPSNSTPDAAPASAPGGNAPGTTGVPVASSSGLVGPDVVARCAGFGPAQAAEILGVPASAVADRSADIAKGLRGCSFARTDGTSGAVSFSLERDESVEAAAQAYASMKDAIPIAENAQTAAGAGANDRPNDSALIEISGLGDEALWTNVNGALTVRVRNLTIQVTEPLDRKMQVAVARKVVGLL